MKVKDIMILVALLFIAGCAVPGVPPGNGILSEPKPPAVPTSSYKPQASPEAVSAIKNNVTATVAWVPVNWGRPVIYLVGWGTSPGNYTTFSRTAQTSYQATGLRYSTLYYFSVKTVDSLGLESDWGQWFHYAPPKPNNPKPAPAPPVQ